MITKYFKWNQSVTRLLSTPAGPYLSGLAQKLEAEGFSYWILRQRVRGAAHFSRWNQRQARSVEQLHENLFKDFAAHLGKCRCQRPLRSFRYENVRVLAGARALVEHLRGCGVVTSSPPSKEDPEPPALLSGFCHWMRNQRGTKENTLSRYSIIITDVLGGLGADPSRYDAESIRTFILSRTRGRSRLPGSSKR